VTHDWRVVTVNCLCWSRVLMNKRVTGVVSLCVWLIVQMRGCVLGWGGQRRVDNWRWQRWRQHLSRCHWWTVCHHHLHASFTRRPRLSSSRLFDAEEWLMQTFKWVSKQFLWCRSQKRIRDLLNATHWNHCLGIVVSATANYWLLGSMLLSLCHLLSPAPIMILSDCMCNV